MLRKTIYLLAGAALFAVAIPASAQGRSRADRAAVSDARPRHGQKRYYRGDMSRDRREMRYDRRHGYGRQFRHGRRDYRRDRRMYRRHRMI